MNLIAIVLQNGMGILGVSCLIKCDAKNLSIIFLLFVMIFFGSTYKHYSSNKNVKNKEFTRNNIDEILNDKISNLPILKNDTDNVIKFNEFF